MTAFADPAARWNQRYTETGMLFGEQPNAWLRAHGTALPPAGRVLCVADGDGRNSVWLAKQGHRVDAFDISPVGVEKARRHAAANGVKVEFAVADGDALAWPEALYDGIAAIFIQYADPAPRARLFANFVRALKPGGVLLLLGYTPKQLVYRTGGPGVADNLYTEALLRESFAALQITELTEYEDELAEGTAHVGRSALIGLVARKPG